MTTSVLFYGTPDFAARILAALLNDSRYQINAVVTQPDKPVGRGNKLSMPPVKALAQEHHLPILQPPRIRSDLSSFLTEARSHGPFDIAVVVAFGQILPDSALALPRAGSLNIHGSLLPRWRGAAPIQRALMNGDRLTGVQLVRMETGLDSGPIFASAETAIENSDTFETLHDRLAQMGADLLLSNLEKIATGALSAAAQSDTGISYAKKIAPDEALIDWSESAQQLAYKIRGLSPYPGAYTFLGEDRLKLLFANPIPEQAEIKAPGTLLSVEQGALAVQCGRGVLGITELQLAGRKRMSAADFLRGVKIEKGVLLGSKK